MNHHFFWILLVLGASCSLEVSSRPDQLRVMTWNVENLFDDVDDGTEYTEFDPQNGWSRQDFWQRCEALAKVIHASFSGGPDLLAMQEVESPRALDVLNSRFLGDLGYKYSYITPSDYPGMRQAILSRYPMLRTGVHYPEPPAMGALRPILEAEYDLGGRRLVVLVNHWKSRIPSPEVTEPQRALAAEVLARRMAELEQRDDHPFVLALGDFNTSVDLSRPWTKPAMAGSLAETHIQGIAVYDPWETAGEPRGSYVYRGKWDSLDHIFVSLSSLANGDWETRDFHPVRFSPQPLAWSPRSRNGVSDHFPLVLTLFRRD